MTALHPTLKLFSRQTSTGPTTWQQNSSLASPELCSSIPLLLLKRWRRKQERKWAVVARGSASLSWSMSRVWDGTDKLASRCSVRGMRWESSETFCQQVYKHPNCEVFMRMLVFRLGGLVLRQRWNRCQQHCPSVRPFIC